MIHIKKYLNFNVINEKTFIWCSKTETINFIIPPHFHLDLRYTLTEIQFLLNYNDTIFIVLHRLYVINNDHMQLSQYIQVKDFQLKFVKAVYLSSLNV